MVALIEFDTFGLSPEALEITDDSVCLAGLFGLLLLLFEACLAAKALNADEH